MEQHESIDLLELWESGDEHAAHAIFDRYAQRLFQLAKSRLSPKLQSRVGAEDVVQSVYRTFFRRAAEGQFELNRPGDLWRLLAAITVTKVKGKFEYHSARKRAIHDEEGSLESLTNGIGIAGTAPEPSPIEANLLIEELNLVMADLKDVQRKIVELALQNISVESIAAQVNRSERTVRRTLGNLRSDLEFRLRQSNH